MSMQQGTNKTPRALEAKQWGSKARKHEARLARRQIDRAVIDEALRNPLWEDSHVCGPECSDVI
jgi:hypothetical protein